VEHVIWASGLKNAEDKISLQNIRQDIEIGGGCQAEHND
jgi:hypothetical protein